MDTCEHCKADLTLPSAEGETSFRAIGIQIQGVYDGVLFWTCPDCGWAMPRWVPPSGLSRLAQPYIDQNHADIRVHEREQARADDDGVRYEP